MEFAALVAKPYRQSKLRMLRQSLIKLKAKDWNISTQEVKMYLSWRLDRSSFLIEITFLSSVTFSS